MNGIDEELQWVDAQRNDGTWKPENPGDILRGVYDKFEETPTGKKLYVIINDEMEMVKVWGGKIIDSYFNHKTGVQIGEQVEIKFVGKVMIEGKFNAQGEPAYYNDFLVRHTLGKRKSSRFSEEDQKDLEAIRQVEQQEKSEEIDPKNIPF